MISEIPNANSGLKKSRAEWSDRLSRIDEYPALAGHSNLSLLAFARGGGGAAVLVAACTEGEGSHREGDDRCDLGDGHVIVRLLSQLVALKENINPDALGTNGKDLTKTLREGMGKKA
jgi:hypothetical protein